MSVVSAVLADDHAVYRHSLERAFARDPRLEVLAAVTDGAAALRAVEHLKPDVVLLDLQMPQLTGVEVAQCLLARGIFVPTLLITAADADAREIAAEAPSVLAVLSKSLSRAVIADALVRVALQPPRES